MKEMENIAQVKQENSKAVTICLSSPALAQRIIYCSNQILDHAQCNLFILADLQV